MIPGSAEACLIDLKLDRLLTGEEVDALAGRGAPTIIIDALPSR
jgi:hypothetical protein